MPDPAQDWLTRKEASLYLYALGFPVSVSTLANMASNNNAGGGPPYTVVGWRSLKYLRRDLDAWARNRIRRVA